jgi:hypothetical protein
MEILNYFVIYFRHEVISIVLHLYVSCIFYRHLELHFVGGSGYNHTMEVKLQFSPSITNTSCSDMLFIWVMY